MSREKTLEEMQKEFLSHVWTMIDWWDKETRVSSPREKLEGLAHSILTAIDGESAAVPGYKLIPMMAEEDKKYYIAHSENYYPEGVDIAGSLNDMLFNEEFLKRNRESNE